MSRKRWNDAGIIPAHAGNTKAFLYAVSSLWDHPRACGEHLVLSPCTTCDQGSSPRMRGTPAVDDVHHRLVGIIPAHAGNTRHGAYVRTLRWDHPRACGEHAGISLHDQGATGSSPRMRGTLTPALLASLRHGIIPAHAGNTDERVRREYSHRDHPRACGEHKALRATAGRMQGSSPRMRGTLVGCSTG